MRVRAGGVTFGSRPMARSTFAWYAAASRVSPDLEVHGDEGLLVAAPSEHARSSSGARRPRSRARRRSSGRRSAALRPRTSAARARPSFAASRSRSSPGSAPSATEPVERLSTVAIESVSRRRKGCSSCVIPRVPPVTGGLLTLAQTRVMTHWHGSPSTAAGIVEGREVARVLAEPGRPDHPAHDLARAGLGQRADDGHDLGLERLAELGRDVAAMAARSPSSSVSPGSQDADDDDRLALDRRAARRWRPPRGPTGWDTAALSTSAGPTRLPATLSVSSERPWMYQKPSASIDAQSPCAQIPGQRDQYVSSYRERSFQKPRVMPGQRRPDDELADGAADRSARPRPRRPPRSRCTGRRSCAGLIGPMTLPPTMPPDTSVPPE